MVLGFAEIRQHIIPAPAGIAELVPMVVICRLPAHVDHAVDRRTAAEDAAPRILDRTTVEARLRCRFEPPIGARVPHAEGIADRDVDPDVVVFTAGFEKGNRGCGVLGQPVREHAPGAAGTDDHVIEGANVFQGLHLPLHRFSRPRARHGYP